MILLEFAAQGIRGVVPAGGRATLRRGYNVVAMDGAVLRRLLEALFYPDARDGETLPRAGGGPVNAPVRAGLTLIGDDGVTYRLVRDFSSGAQLHRFDAGKRSFALVSQDLAEIARAMQAPIGVPAPARLSALLCVASGELPSRQGSGAGALLPAAAPPRTGLTREQASRRREALRAELEKAKLAEKLQYELDGLQSRLFKIEEGLKEVGKLHEGLEKAEAARAEVAGATAVAARLGDPDAKLAAFDKASARRAEAVERVAAERETLGASEAGGQPRRFWSDPLFWAGAGGGVGVALAGVVGAALVPGLRYLALLDIPAFGLAAFVANRWIGSVEEQERVSRRRRIVDEWERKIEAQYERDAAEVRDAMRALGVSKPTELKDALTRVAAVEAGVAEWSARLAEWEASPAAQGTLAEKAKVEEALRDVESRLSGEAGGYVRDVRSVEAELHRLETEPVEDGTPAAAPAPAAARPAVAVAGEPLRTLLERAAAELGGSPTAAARAVAQKASQALSGLSFQRLQGLQVDERGNIQVQVGGRPVAAMTLSPVDRDMVWIALKLSFVEQALASGKSVALADDALSGLSEGARRFAARLLKQIARPGQLLHATADPSFREAADHAA